MEFSFHIPSMGDVVLGLVLSLYFLTVCAAVSVPWIAAHLEFWGSKEEMTSYLPAASRLSQIAIYNLGGVFLFGMLSFLIVSFQTMDRFFTATILLAPALGVFLILLAGYILLLFLYQNGWRGRKVVARAHVLMGVAAGTLAALCLAILVAWMVAVCDESLWLSMRTDAWSIFRNIEFWFGWLYAFFAVFMTGGVVLMLTGRDAFRWESGSSVSDGARLIRLGAIFALAAIFLMVILTSGWIVVRGLGPFRQLIFIERTELIPLAVVSFAGMIALVEILMSILKWRGSAPRASLLVAVCLFLTVFGVTSLFSWKSPTDSDDKKTVVSSQEMRSR